MEEDRAGEVNEGKKKGRLQFDYYLFSGSDLDRGLEAFALSARNGCMSFAIALVYIEWKPWVSVYTVYIYVETGKGRTKLGNEERSSKEKEDSGICERCYQVYARTLTEFSCFSPT